MRQLLLIKKYIYNQNLWIKILAILTLVVFYLKLFIFNEIYPLHDEIIGIDRFTDPWNFFRRNGTANHQLLSFFAFIIKFLFGYNFIFYRLISFVAFAGIIFYLLKFSKNLYVFFIFIFFITFSDLLFNYIYIFRGYQIYALISVMLFYYLNLLTLKQKEKYFNYILFLNVLLLCHSFYTAYIVIPILFYLFLITLTENTVNRIKNTFLYFITPLCLFYFFLIYLEGFILNTSIDIKSNGALIYLINFLSFNNFFLFFESGFNSIFLAPEFSTTFSFKYYNLFNYFFNEGGLEGSLNIIFLIYITALVICLYRFFFIKKNNKHLEYIIIFIITFYLFHTFFYKPPFKRVHVGSSYFFIFYIISNINFEFLKKKYVNLSFFILTLILLSLAKPSPNFWETKDVVDKINTFKGSCEEANQFDEYVTWILINYYPDRCNYRYDFQKNKNILFSY